MGFPSLARRLLLAAVVIGGAYYLLTPGAPPLDDLGRASALSGSDTEGRALSLQSFAGQVVLVDFWATWCPGCREELGGLSKLHDALKPKGFTVLGVALDEDASAVPPFVRSAGLSFPVLQKPGKTSPEGWSIPGLPLAFLIGRDGTILRRYEGMKDLDAVKTDAKSALAR